MRRFLTILVAAAALCVATPIGAQTDAIDDTLREGYRLYDGGQRDAARAQFEQTLAAAERAGNIRAEADAHRGLGLVILMEANYAGAREEFDRALTLFQSIGDRSGAGRVELHLGKVAQLAGDWPKSEDWHRRGYADFAAAGDAWGQARALYGMTYNDLLGAAAIETLLSDAEAIVTRLGDKGFLAEIAMKRSDDDYKRGDFAAAMTHLESAITLFEQTGDRLSLARALTSLGRLNRVHGHPDRAVELYERARGLQEAIGDQQGVIQTINATAVAYDALGRHAEALVQYEQALALARQTGSQRLITFQLGNLGGAYIKSGNYAKAAEILEDVVRQPNDPLLAAIRSSQLGEAYIALGRFRDALVWTDKSLAIFRELNDLVNVVENLTDRSHEYQKLGRSTDALADAREALETWELLRTRLVPTDFMKQGFSQLHLQTFALAIDLLHALGDDAQALLTAERAEGRAFLDLLASRGLADAASSLVASSRGLASAESMPPVSLDDIKATARRLQSTLVAYYVTPDATFIWVVGPTATIHAAKVDVKAARLNELIRQTRPQGDRPSPAVKAASPVATRGGDVFFFGASHTTAWRELYALLIRPVRGYLPATTGSRLTIVPNGPLFLLSFAALTDERGQYLLEKYTLHYAPSAAMLQFTGKRKTQLADMTPRYLLVADPASMPVTDRPLQSLPGSRREVTTIAQLLPRDGVTLLTGSGASESAVRDRMHDATVIHLATHGIVRDDDPLESFLALGRSESPVEDGKLSAAKIYGLDLRADLVMLSACGTALGALSGDGIAGLTRAFFYAGAISVVATMWDVADEPTYRLVPEFYRLRSAGRDKAAALRSAQLRLLNALRAGRVTLAGVTLPEDPFFWAAFVLMGEP